MKNILFLFSFLFFFVACSLLPPSTKEFENNLKSLIGNTERGYQGQKVIQKKNKKEWYYSNDYIKCQYIIITDLKNTIINYKILTPNTCKAGYPAVW